MINPFRNKIFTDPLKSLEADVPEINSDAFDFCIKALNRVREQEGSTSVLIFGEAGNGKTHLLARIRHYLIETNRLHVFVSVRLQTSPNRLWRHIRRCFADSLIREVRGRFLLEWIFFYRLRQLGAKNRFKIKELRSFLRNLREKGNFSFNLCRILENLALNRNRMDIVDWLRGDSLDENAVSRLGLVFDHADDDAEEAEYRSRELIYELCRLAGECVPVLFCFDQIEALQRFPGDIAGVFAFGQAVRALHDETQNVLLVSCVQTFFLGELKNAVMEPDYDALSANRMNLGLLNIEQAEKLVSARLSICKETEQTRKILKQRFRNDLENFVGPGKTARQVLLRCSDLFDAWQTGKSLKNVVADKGIPVDRFLANEFGRRENQAISHVTASRTDAIVQHALPVLGFLCDETIREKSIRKRGSYKDIDMVFEVGNKIVGVSLCNQENMKSLAARLRNLNDRICEGNLHSLVIIRNSDLPISPGAKKSMEYLEDLKRQNVRLLQPDAETIGALEALSALLADAKSGDLSDSGRTVEEKTVRQWLKKHLPDSVNDFAEAVFTSQKGEPDQDFRLFQSLISVLKEKRVLRLSDCVKIMKVDEPRLEMICRRHPKQIGLLSGPPPVIFHYIPDNYQMG